MAEAVTRRQWGQTSSLMALLANCHRDPKRRARPFAPKDFDPFYRPVKTPKSKSQVKDEIALLAGAWVKKRKR